MLLIALIASGTFLALAGFGWYELIVQGQEMLATSAAASILCAIVYGWYLALTAPLDDSAQ